MNSYVLVLTGIFFHHVVVVVLNVVVKIELVHFGQLESHLVELSDIFFVVQILKVTHQTQEFLVLFVILKGGYRNTIRQLRTKGVHCIIDYDDVFQISVAENSQIFNVNAIR